MKVKFIGNKDLKEITVVGISPPRTYKKGDTIEVPEKFGHALLRDPRNVWEEVTTKSKKEDKA